MKIGSIVHRLETCPSTNDVAKALARAGEEEGAVVIARGQTSGKGTKGRAWHSAPGKGLYASFILRPVRAELTLLPLVGGLAAAEAVSLSGELTPLLKWPNDIVWEGKKLGGILCESKSLSEPKGFVVMGIGINVNQEGKDFDADVGRLATSLKLALGRETEVETVFRSLCAALDAWYARLESGGSADVVEAFLKRLVFRPRQVLNLSLPSGRFSGIFCGIDPGGGLILEDGGGTRTFFSAEILTVRGEE